MDRPPRLEARAEPARPLERRAHPRPIPGERLPPARAPPRLRRAGAAPVRLRLGAIALVGFALRVAYGLVANVPNGFGDDVWFHSVANGLVHGRGFSSPFRSMGPAGAAVFGTVGDPITPAFPPPLFPWLLALFSAVGL